jgi:CDP-6-deoxy-D-xylo-4-hexulose-3-dehydrase
LNNKQKIPSDIISSLHEIITHNLSEEIIPGKDLIPAAAPSLLSTDIINSIESLANGWLTEGDFCNQFEKKLAKYFKTKFAIVTNSGSSANLLALSALTSPKLGNRALKKGDEVITVAAGFPTTINPIVQNGLIPVFVDIEVPSYNIDVRNLEDALSNKTRAIIIAHSLGNPFDIETIVSFAKKHNLWLIEDNCDALGATYNGQLTGTFGDLSTLSFFPAHQITTGEGGAVIINNPSLKKLVESFKNWGRDCWCIPGDDNTCGTRYMKQHGDLPQGYDHKYVFSHIGYNLKMTESQAAMGLKQLERVDHFIAKRRENHKYLLSLFKELEGHFILPEKKNETEPSWFGFMLSCKPHINRGKLLTKLNKDLIGTRLFFSGNITKQPAYKNIDYRVIGNLNQSDFVMNNSFWLGVWPQLEKHHLDFIFNSVKSFIKEEVNR